MSKPNPAIAAALSLALPGLGHTYGGRLTSGLLFAAGIPLATIGLGSLAAMGYLPLPVSILPLYGGRLGSAIRAFQFTRTANDRGTSTAAGRLGAGLGTLVLAVLGTLMLRGFVVEPFHIPSASMAPSIARGDYIFAAKGPFINEIQRGDVVVFSVPRDPNTAYVKRVMALAGDRIAVHEGRPVLNGAAVAWSGITPDVLSGRNCVPSPIQRRTEQIDQHTYSVLLREGGSALSEMAEITIPDAHYFLMGDNRDASEDSRVFGPIPSASITGKAQEIWYSAPPCGEIGFERRGPVP